MNGFKIITFSLRLLTIIFLFFGARIIYADSPADSLNSYIEAMRRHNSSPELDFYTVQTRNMLRSWTVTSTQMDNIVNTYIKCGSGETVYNDSYNLAVIRHSIKQKQCSPWFFQNDGGKWLLDLTMMQRAIRFGVGNAWHFAAGIDHEYRFGFSDWEFDSNGYPVSTD